MVTTHSARILADSVNIKGCRLTTMVITIPRIVLAEFNTHRMLSRNSASSRAIPVEKMLKMVIEDPYVPSEWGSNQKGMSAGEPLPTRESNLAVAHWLQGRDRAVETAKSLLELGVHKQLSNRVLEPYMWHTILVSATEWDNFFNLRCHPAAHPDIRATAEKMRAALGDSKPSELLLGDYHLPFINDEDREQVLRESDSDYDDSTAHQLAMISVGRCARVSYLTHEGKRDISKDIELAESLLKNGHLSPFEHVAYAGAGDFMIGNFRGWVQERKSIQFEENILGTF